jgi:hypothetical protein
MKANNDINLNNIISFSESEGLNIEGTSGIKEVFGFGGTIVSFSGDPEILLNIRFRELVNINAIMIEGSMSTGK